MKQDLCSVLEQEIDETRNVLQRITRDLKRLPKGKLEVGRVRDRYVQYHAVTWKNGRQVREYVGRENMKLAEQLAQQTYENKAKKAAERRLRGLEQALKLAVKTDLMEVYIRESPERRKLIIPLLSTDEQYIEQWYAEHPGDKNSFMKTTAYTTVKGETVRSKSEKMIADAYYAAGVPYVYEPTVILSNGKTKYPDFAVLNVRLRRTMYHEHFGMMDDDEYRQNTMLKIREYNKNGYPAGECMLFTFEGENIPFDQEELDELIRVYLM